MSELSLSAEKIYLWSDPSIRTRCDRPSITPYLCSEPGIRPAILVIPGGGYGMVCETTEGSPIARKFNELGFHAFVLDYRTAPSRWPEPQLDAMRAVKIIRGRADEWQIDGEKVSVCGFQPGRIWRLRWERCAVILMPETVMDSMIFQHCRMR